MQYAYKQWFAPVANAKIISRVARQLLPDWVTVFMLHRIELPELGIHGLKPEYLRRCLQYLRDEGFEFISLEQAIAKSLADRLEKKKWIAFSLDDGYFEQLDVAAEVFQQFDCPATFFLITDFIDGSAWPWDHKLVYIVNESRKKQLNIEIDGRIHLLDLDRKDVHRAVIDFVRKNAAQNAYKVVTEIARQAEVDIPATPPEAFRPTTWDKVRGMEKRGMLFGAHSTSHRIMSRLDNTELKREIEESMSRLRQECARPANIFCYPSGKMDEFDDRAVQRLKELDVLGAFSAEPGYLSGPRIRKDQDYRFAIPRMTIPDNFTEFKLYVSWAQYVRESLQLPNKQQTIRRPDAIAAQNPGSA